MITSTNTGTPSNQPTKYLPITLLLFETRPAHRLMPCGDDHNICSGCSLPAGVRRARLLFTPHPTRSPFATVLSICRAAPTAPSWAHVGAPGPMPGTRGGSAVSFLAPSACVATGGDLSRSGSWLPFPIENGAHARRARKNAAQNRCVAMSAIRPRCLNCGLVCVCISLSLRFVLPCTDTMPKSLGGDLVFRDWAPVVRMTCGNSGRG